MSAFRRLLPVIRTFSRWRATPAPAQCHRHAHDAAVWPATGLAQCGGHGEAARADVVSEAPQPLSML